MCTQLLWGGMFTQVLAPYLVRNIRDFSFSITIKHSTNTSVFILSAKPVELPSMDGDLHSLDRTLVWGRGRINAPGVLVLVEVHNG